MAQDQRKAELSAELAHARGRIAQGFGAVRDDLDFPGRAKKAVLKHPLAWVGGATLVGVVLAKLPARKKTVMIRGDGKEVKMSGAGKVGLVLGALKVAFLLSRPAITKWAGERIASYMQGTKSNGHLR